MCFLFAMSAMKKQWTMALCAVICMVSPVLHAAYLIEVDTDGLDDGVLVYSPDFAFGGDTTVAYQSVKGTAIGLTGGDSIYGGNGTVYLDTYVYTYAPDSQTDNLFFNSGTPLGNGDYASGAAGGGPGRYAVYATWPNTSNVSGGPTTYQVDTAIDSTSFSVDQNSIGNVWVKVGEVNYTNGPITVTQTPESDTGVSMRSAGVLFERLSDTPGGGYTGPPGPVIFGQGSAGTFGVAFVRNRAAAQTNHFSVLQGTNLTDWSTSDLKLYSITDLDAQNELVTFRLMDPMAGINHQFLKVQAIPKMPPDVPYVAMTYDDGPHPDYTPLLLDMLKERNIRATFYVVGINAQRYPHILRRMINEGHEIGNHSMSHPYLTRLSDAEVIAEVAGCRDAVVAAATLPTATIRPPYGDVNQHLRDLFLSEFGYPTIIWDVDPKDWDPAVSDQKVVNTILTQSDHDEIILTHDIQERTVLLMPEILDGLLAQGFSFVTVTELLELRGN
jgi:peptidoglycan/xylan/chitin deacetylase (PgdA/CDA1 family)